MGKARYAPEAIGPDDCGPTCGMTGPGTPPAVWYAYTPAEIKHLEDYSPSPGESPAQVEEVLKRARADLEVSTNLEQQRQATANEAEQQLRTEQERLRRLETQLDELVKNVGNFNGQSVPH